MQFTRGISSKVFWLTRVSYLYILYVVYIFLDLVKVKDSKKTAVYLYQFHFHLRWGLFVLESEILIWTQAFFHRSQIQHSCWSRTFNCFSRLCLILAFKTFSEDCLPFPYPSLFSSGVCACWKQWNNICMLLVIINYGDSAQHGHLRASLSRSDISNVSWQSGECMVVSYTIFICSCPETSISQTHLYLS